MTGPKENSKIVYFCMRFVYVIACFTFLYYFLIEWESRADYTCKCSVLLSHLLKLKKKEIVIFDQT